MSTNTKTGRFRVVIEASFNGRMGPATVTVLDGKGNVVLTDRANLAAAPQRKRVAKLLAEKTGIEVAKALELIETAWNEKVTSRQRMADQMAAGSAEAAPAFTSEIASATPPRIRRPLCLLDGVSCAAAWVTVRTTTTRSVDTATGAVTNHDPPFVQLAEKLVIVRQDGKAFGDGVPLAAPLADLGLPVHLPSVPAPGSGWSGAGVRRYLGGGRPDPADVFRRVAAVIDHFLDFDRSLGPQPVMCELVAAYVLASYFLDAFHVAGYAWPTSADPGSGKTTFLHVVADLGYLGQLVQSGGSYASLRDLADYGACLAFDDAENVMDKKADPDKRTLLLAGNRKGATVTVKEATAEKQWVTRHVDTYCPRLFSAIKLPDPVLGSRSIVFPLVRSGDLEKVKRVVADHETWPHNRRQLVDDLWALALAHLPELREHDKAAAGAARLGGRNLEPWRAVLAVAHWLDAHGMPGLFGRLEALSVRYQSERQGFERDDGKRLVALALVRIVGDQKGRVAFTAKEVGAAMKAIIAEGGEGEVPTDAKIGYALKALRVQKVGHKRTGNEWSATRAEAEAILRAYTPPKLPEEEADEF